EQLVFIARSLSQLFVGIEDRQRLHHMARPILARVTSIGARRCFDGNAIAIEKYTLHSGPEKTIPSLAAGICEIEDRLGRIVRRATLISDVLIEEGNRGRYPSHQI